MSNGGIYEIRNNTSGVRYVGSAKCIATRLKQHAAMLRRGSHHSVALQRAWIKYGPDAFVMRPIAILEERELLSTEQRLLDIEHAGETYNISKDAIAWFKGRTHTKEWRTKHSERMKGNPSRTGIPSHWKGKHLSSEHRAKLSEAKKKITDETRAKMRETKLNDAVAIARLKAISASNIGKKQSSDQIEKRAEKLRGRKMPDGALAKAWQTRRANKLLGK